MSDELDPDDLDDVPDLDAIVDDDDAAADDDDYADWPPYVLRPTWYEKHDTLRLIQQWARTRMVPPDVVLVDMLAELIARAPLCYRLPGIIGGAAALNFGAVVVAPTGVGKTTRRLLHREMLFGDPAIERIWPLGTGEGLTESLLAPYVKGEERVPHGEPVLILSDEGRELDALARRQGSTLLSTLTSAISGAPLGQGNATAATRRIVPALSYKVLVLLAIQPELLGGPLADVESGLPQRFLFVSGTGHDIGSAEIPKDDPLQVALPRFEAPTIDPGRVRFVDVPMKIRKQVRQEHLDRLKAIDVGEPVADGSHRNLLRLRIATALGMLDGDMKMSEANWEHAEALVDVSDATVMRGEAMRRTEREDAERRARATAARTAVVTDAAVEQDRIERAAVKIALAVTRTPGITTTTLRRKLTTSARDVFEDAVDFAKKRFWVEERNPPSHTGDDRRELHPGERRP